MNPVNLFFIFCFVLLQMNANAQQKDSVIIKNDSIYLHQNAKDSLPKKEIVVKKDSVVKKKHDPHKATLYSAILPGAGQVYNKKYWKLPLVYAAIGIPAYTYFYNKSWYQKCQYALSVAVSVAGNPTGPDNLPQSTKDSLAAVTPAQLQTLAAAGETTSIVNARNEFRKNQDYSALFFLIFWGLQIVDATVDAHLRDFNVTDDLSLRIKPAIIPGPGYISGISFVFDIHKGKTKLIDIRN